MKANSLLPVSSALLLSLALCQAEPTASAKKAKIIHSEFTVTVKGGPLDGQTFTGMTEFGTSATAGGNSRNGVSTVTFSGIPLKDTTYRANFGLTWKGALEDGKKEQHFDGSGTAKYGKSGHFNVFNKDSKGEFSNVRIEFKDSEVTISDATAWNSEPSDLYEGKTLRGKGQAKATVSKIFKEPKMNAISKNKDTTVTFSFVLKAARRK